MAPDHERGRARLLIYLFFQFKLFSFIRLNYLLSFTSNHSFPHTLLSLVQAHAGQSVQVSVALKHSLLVQKLCYFAAARA